MRDDSKASWGNWRSSSKQPSGVLHSGGSAACTCCCWSTRARTSSVAPARARDRSPTYSTRPAARSRCPHSWPRSCLSWCGTMTSARCAAKAPGLLPPVPRAPGHRWRARETRARVRVVGCAVTAVARRRRLVTAAADWSPPLPPPAARRPPPPAQRTERRAHPDVAASAEGQGACARAGGAGAGTGPGASTGFAALDSSPPFATAKCATHPPHPLFCRSCK